MAVKNSTIINKIWLNGTNDFQQRIPQPTQTNIDATVKALLDPMNKQYYNQFIDSLIMRIGYTEVKTQQYTNPLKVFKGSKLLYGDTIQEIIPKWIKAHSYEDDAVDVFKMNRPDVATWYHSQNRRDYYPITLNETELRTAFTDNYGLNKLVVSLLEVPTNSDEYDEYCIMLQLIAFYENNWGFFKHQLSAIPNDEATGKEFLTAVRTYAEKLPFPSTIYNSGAIEDVPVFVKQNELVLLITPEVKANIDVQTLASVFQLDKAELKYRTIVVNEFPIPNVAALLTTRDFFMCKDTVYETTSMYNPKTLATNYYLHHWGVYSVSPFVPAILFTTDAATNIETVTQTLTGITASIENNMPEPGDTTAITITLAGSLSDTSYAGIKLAPDACTYDVTVYTADGNAIKDPTTRVDEYGILHVGKKLPAGANIEIECTSTWVNPSGETTSFSASVTATVTLA